MIMTRPAADDRTLTAPARLAAAAVALVAWAGLGVQLSASVALVGTIEGAIWVMLRYFTVLANLGLALALTGVALGVRRGSSPALLAGVTLALVLVGVVYGLLLRGLVDLSGGAQLADLLLHHATPILAPLFWLVFVPKGALSRGDPLRWAVFPLVYFLYAILRGLGEGIYAYPFMNLDRLGWGQTGLNALVMGAAFLLCGAALVRLDGFLARSASR